MTLTEPWPPKLPTRWPADPEQCLCERGPKGPTGVCRDCHIEILDDVRIERGVNP